MVVLALIVGLLLAATPEEQLLQAARTGSAEALTTLAGRLGPEDRLLARACLELAAEAGDAPAKIALAGLPATLSADDRAAVDAIKHRYFEAYGAPS